MHPLQDFGDPQTKFLTLVISPINNDAFGNSKLFKSDLKLTPFENDLTRFYMTLYLLLTYCKFGNFVCLDLKIVKPNNKWFFINWPIQNHFNTLYNMCTSLYGSVLMVTDD